MTVKNFLRYKAMIAQEKNPFREIGEHEKVPGELKEKVMKNVTLLQLFGDMTENLMDRMGKSMKDFLKAGKGLKN